MPRKAPWIERQFGFGCPVSMFPNVLERLRGTPARLEERLGGLAEEALKARIDGGWSLQEIAGHLVDVEDLWLGRLDDFAAGAPELRPADMSNRRTDAADYNARDLAEILARFRSQREAYVARLEALTTDEIARTAHHPRLSTPMRVLDAMIFAAEHDDHHLARITEILGEPS